MNQLLFLQIRLFSIFHTSTSLQCSYLSCSNQGVIVLVKTNEIGQLHVVLQASNYFFWSKIHKGNAQLSWWFFRICWNWWMYHHLQSYLILRFELEDWSHDFLSQSQLIYIRMMVSFSRMKFVQTAIDDSTMKDLFLDDLATIH